MVDKKTTDSSEIIRNTFGAFVNLLKEFPRSAIEDFIYDESTLKKISKGNDALKALNSAVRDSKSEFSTEQLQTIKDCQTILSLLMEEMPLSPEDEFLYDSEIHQQVEKAREAVVKLGDLFS